MLKMMLALFLLISICGCAASVPRTDQRTALGSIRETLNNYNDCLRQNVKPYLGMKTTPNAIADAVAGKCEPKLRDYKIAVREIFAKGLNPGMSGYNNILISKPETHAAKIREKGRRATIARVLDARKAEID